MKAELPVPVPVAALPGEQLLALLVLRLVSLVGLVSTTMHMRASDDDACEPQRLPSEVAEGMVLTVRVEVSLVCLVDIILTVPSGDEVSQTRGCFDQRRFDQKRLAPCQSAGAKTARRSPGPPWPLRSRPCSSAN